MELIKLLIIAACIEAIWQNLKMCWGDGRFSLDKIGTLALGVFIAVYAGLDIFAMLGIPLGINVAGAVLTGILVSRGAAVVHDLIDSISAYKA